MDASHTAASDATRADATGAAVASSPDDPISAAWSRLDAWRRTLPTDAPEPFRGPASDDDLLALEAGVGVALPEAWRASLRLHDGQETGRTEPFAGETLLSARQILAQWSLWRELVAHGDLADSEGGPEPGIRGDWYNPKWIPLTHDGSGDHLCVDLDPDEGGPDRPGDPRVARQSRARARGGERGRMAGAPSGAESAIERWRRTSQS